MAFMKQEHKQVMKQFHWVWMSSCSSGKSLSQYSRNIRNSSRPVTCSCHALVRASCQVSESISGGLVQMGAGFNRPFRWSCWPPGLKLNKIPLWSLRTRSDWILTEVILLEVPMIQSIHLLPSHRVAWSDGGPMCLAPNLPNNSPRDSLGSAALR